MLAATQSNPITRPASTHSRWGIESCFRCLWNIVKEIFNFLTCCCRCPNPLRVTARRIDTRGGLMLHTDFPVHNATFLPETFNIGIYGPQYHMTQQLLTLKLPPQALQFFPEEVRNRFIGLGDDQIELSLAIHQDLQASTRVRNLITHPIAYPECEQNVDRAQAHFSMGIFAMNGVSVQDNDRYLFANGFYPMDVHLHRSMVADALPCISPNNCRFEVTAPVSTFVTAIDLRAPLIPVPQPILIPYRNKGAACFHILLNDASAIARNLGNSNTLPEFVETLPEPLKGQIRNLLCLTT